MSVSAPPKAVFRVIDAYDHPHGGRILRLRLRKGQVPRVKELRGSTFLATDGAPEATEMRLPVDGFALFGGRPKDARIVRSGRVDLLTTGRDAHRVEPGWELSGPV